MSPPCPQWPVLRRRRSALLLKPEEFLSFRKDRGRWPAKFCSVTADFAERVRSAAAAAAEAVRRDGGELRPLGKKASRTRDHLLAHAYLCFADRGYQGTSMADIAATAGVSLGTVYQYFRDKADVMATLVGTAVLDQLTGSRRWDALRGRAELRRVISSFVRNYEDTVPFQKVWEEVTHVVPELARLRWDLSALFASAVEQALCEGQEQGVVRDDLDAASMALALTSMVDRTCYLNWVASDSPAPVDDIVELLTSLWAAAIGLGEE